MQLAPVRKTENNPSKLAETLPSLRNQPPALGPRGGAVSPLYHTLETNGQPAFKAVVWREARLNTVELTRVHRQRQPELVLALNDLRENNPASAHVARLLRETRRPLVESAATSSSSSSSSGVGGEDGGRNGVRDEPVRLFCGNEACDRLNAERLKVLTTEPEENRPRQSYPSKDWVEVDEETVMEAEDEAEQAQRRHERCREEGALMTTGG